MKTTMTSKLPSYVPLPPLAAYQIKILMFLPPRTYYFTLGRPRYPSRSATINTIPTVTVGIDFPRPRQLFSIWT